MERRIREFDWSKTPLGPIAGWPQSLRTTVNILLSSRYAMWMAWGPELTMLYNDAYQPTLGIKHPVALGMPASAVWAEIWPEIGPRIETVLRTGKATYDEGLRLFLERSGFPEETYHTFSYSPLLDDRRIISGMLCVVTEESERVIGERRVETLRDVASALANTSAEEEVLRVIGQRLSQNPMDLPFTLVYLFDDNGTASLAASTGFSLPHALAPAEIDAAQDFPWPARQIRQRPAHDLLEDLAEHAKAGTLPCGEWNKAPQRVAIVPLKAQGQEQAAGFFVAGTNPFRRYDLAYSGFIDLIAGQISAALGNARAYAAERQRAEALAELDRAKTTFFSNVSHELRTPLTLMLSPVEELIAESDGRSSQRQVLELIHRNGLRLQRLVNTLLDFSRIEAGRMQAVYEAVDLCRFTEDLASNFHSAMDRAGLRFEVRCEPLHEAVYVDREMWEKIVLNLLSNALKFTLQGGVTVSLRDRGNHAELAVADTGAGIPETELPHLFERFHRVSGTRGRSIEGTGIGLALVQELVKLHGGSIEVSSRIGEGTTFLVSIPFGAGHLPKDKLATASLAWQAAKAGVFIDEASRWVRTTASGDHSAAADGSREATAGAHILLADDNADMREYLTRLLEPHYTVTGTGSGGEALKAARQSKPDLILSDVMMPDLDGFGLLKELRADPKTSTIPVILVSARAGEESRVEGLGAGADDYLVKPFTARELLARVGAHLAMRRRTMEAERALHENQAVLQSFYDSSPFLMGIVELDGEAIHSIYGNRATAKFAAKLPGSEPNGDPSRRLIPPGIDAIWSHHFRQSQRQGGPSGFEYDQPVAGGVCWLRVSVNYLGDGPGGLPRFSFVGEDITDRKKADELLRRSNEDLRQANIDLEQFAYSASHDLQEPLRQVAIYSQMLQRKYADKLEGKAYEYLGYCVEGAHRMSQLISGLLAYSQVTRTAEVPHGTVKVAEVLDTARKNLATTIAETHAQITIGDMPEVPGDAVPLVHLFQNLLSNALKYRKRETPRVEIAAVKDGDYWRFSVTDNGIGIAKEFQQQIFGIFKRLHDRSEYPGTGIGLAICQKIVERYGGRIWVESEPGKGSSFCFTLPRAI